MIAAVKIVFLTSRGLRTLFGNALAFFGLISALIQFYGAVFVPTHSLSNPLAITIATAGASFLYGLLRTWPRSKVNRVIRASASDVEVTVKIGDILSYDGQIAVGFSDTFDTDTTENKVISAKSLQGQLLAKRFNDDSSELDRQLNRALPDANKASRETRSDKPLGKLQRYEIGTVAVLGTGAERIYAVAYSKMSNELVAESSVHNIWGALGELWSAVYTHGQHEPIALPLVGTGLSRINYLDRESMLRMTLLSFVARSREKLVCNKLTVFIHPSDRDKINMLELKAFLKTL